MTSQNNFEQLYDETVAELERLFALKAGNKESQNSGASISRSSKKESISSFINQTCNSTWMCEWASTRPISIISFLNRIHEECSRGRSWGDINRDIQQSKVYKLLITEHPEECNKFLKISPMSEEKMRNITLVSFLDGSRRAGCNSKQPINNQFKMAASDFQTIKQVWEVRDEVRRRLIVDSLINNHFKTRDAAKFIGCKTDGALAGNVRALFATPDFRRETIEPVINSWKRQTAHPFQPVIEDLVALGTLPMVEAQIKEFYPHLIMKSAAKCQFVKIRMAEFHGVSERTLTNYITDLGMDEEFSSAHREFLEAACKTVGYNISQVATLLNVDVRLVTQQIANYGIEKPNGNRDTRAPWPFG